MTDMMENYDNLNTPELVRMYRDLHIMGSHRKLSDDEQIKLSFVVNELRLRRVLD